MRSTVHLRQLFALLLYVVVFVYPHPGYSQRQLTAPIMAYNHSLTTENGLSENNVSSVVKDREGFMWIGTGNGLNRFDGYSVVHYHHSDKDTSSISNNAVRNMLLDSKGRLWVGTFSGLNLYDREKETFRKFWIGLSHHDKITDNSILYLLEDSHHRLWVGSFGEISIVDLETLNIVTYDHENDGTGLGALNTLIEDRKGKIWAATSKGIYVMDSTTRIERIIRPNGAPGGLPPDVTVVSMIQDDTGAIYFGSNGNGVLRLDHEDDETFTRFTSTTDAPFFGSDLIGALAVDKNGKLLVGTDGAGIYKQDGDEEFRQILGSQSRHLHKGNIIDIFVDDHNTYWLSLYGGGVQVVYANSKRFEHYRYFDLEMERIGKNSVLAIAEDQHRKIWIGTDGAGLYKFDPVLKSFTAYRHSSSNKNSLSANVVKSLLIDEKNNVYAGTFGGGLNYLNTKTGSITRYMHVPGDDASIGTNHVWSLLQSSDHGIYAGQLAGLDEFFQEKKSI